MKVVITFKADPRMKAAIEKQAGREFASISGIVKKAVQEYLDKHGIDWRVEEPEK